MEDDFRKPTFSTIYTLTNPQNNQVFYVGATIMPLRKRLIVHLNHARTSQTIISQYIKSILDKSFVPTIELLDGPFEYTNDIGFIEQYWIHQLFAWGFDLKNVVHHPMRWPPKYPNGYPPRLNPRNKVRGEYPVTLDQKQKTNSRTLG